MHGLWRASLVAQLVKNLPARQETLVWFLGWEDAWGRDRLPTPVFMGFPGGSDGKESACSVGDLGLIPGLGRFPGGGHGNPLQYSGLENPHGQRSLEGYSQWGCKEPDMTEWLTHTHTLLQLWQSYVLGNKYTRLTQNLDPQRIRQAQMALKSHQQCRH